MDIREITVINHLELVPIFVELEKYYFGEQAAKPSDIESYFLNGLFASHSGVRVVAAFISSEVIGFATYSIMYPAPRLSGQMFMKDLFVSSKARSQGVGQSLMKYLAKFAIEKGCNRLDWTAESSNPKAGEFYRSIGARLVTEKEYFRFEGDKLFEFSQRL
mmetsp:Transcript_82912/g.162562  ORF Transcript_82912/g.162562 Transcript_82912/m.162562 type:complete len:161 (+) Transcript_82912:107-589(+)